MSTSRVALRALGLVLILIGIGLIVITIGIYAYASYEQSIVESQLRASGLNTSLALEGDPSSATAETEEIGITSASEYLGIEDSGPSPNPEGLPPTSTATPKPAPARQIRIPKIGVDSPVVEAKLKDGEWEVPKYVAGHLEGTANPGENGNMALTGHVQSLTSGNVFARLEELRAGDDVFLYAGNREFHYRVKKVFVVKNDDLSVLQPTPFPTLTLITCTGTWNPFTRDYPERFIVSAEPVDPDQ